MARIPSSFSFSHSHAPALRALRSRRGQSSFEYLSTYGFALLGLLITLGVISYFGFFNPNTIRASDCSFPNGFSCVDYVAGNGDPGVSPPGPGNYLRMNLVNAYGVNISIAGASMYSTTLGKTTPCQFFQPVNPWVEGTNKTIWCQLPSDYIAGERYDGAVTINFTQTGGAYVHSVAGRYSLLGQ